jgi:hypothetical protein
LVDVNFDNLADDVFVTFEGAFILARALGDTAQMARQLRLLRQLLQMAPGVSAPVSV